MALGFCGNVVWPWLSSFESPAHPVKSLTSNCPAPGAHSIERPFRATSRHMQCGKTELLFDHLAGAGERRGPRVMSSNGLRLRDLFENATFGLDADCDKCDGRDQIGESKRIKGPAAEPVSEHEADHRGCQERADAPDAEEPADSRGPQMGRVQFADVDAGSAVYAGVDPTDQEGRDIGDKTRRHRKRQMEE